MYSESERRFGFDGDEVLKERFEKMLSQKQIYYFDVEEFETIIDNYMVGGEYDKAFKAISMGLYQHPNSSEILYFKAQALIDNESYKEALEVLHRLEKIDPRNPHIFLLQGAACLFLENYQKTESLFNKAVSLTDKSNIYEILNSIGEYYLDAEFFLEAGKFLKQALKYDDNNLDIIYNIAICCENSFDFKNAIRYYNYYLDREPYDIIAWFYLGNSLSKDGQYKKAVEALDYCIAIDDAYDMAYFQKAYNLFLDNLFNESITWFKEFMKFKRDSYIGYYHLARCYQALNDFKNAKKFYKKTIDSDIQFNYLSPEPFYRLGQVYEDNNQLTISIRYYRQAIQIEPKKYELWLALGGVYKKMNKEDLSVLSFQRAVSVNPGNVDVLIECSKALVDFSRWEELAKLAGKAKKNFPDNEVIKVYWATGIIKSGKIKKHLSEISQVLKNEISLKLLLSLCKDDGEFIRLLSN